ncbi:hypothetical protein JTB14_023426 [Gonioctena quinquepunctata]|nr:hypothetical protein JTB14_023426 [Gonioctena quinquepunctata]
MIESADCTCPRGQFMCHHMAALAIFGHYNVSVTDKACTWSSKKEAPSTSEVKRITQLYPTKVHRSTERDLTVQEIEGFKDKLKMFDGAVGFTWLFSSELEANTESLVVGIEDVIFDETYFKTVDEMKYICEKLQMSHEKILKVAELTIGQAQNEKWLVCRKHRLTASNFGVVLGACKRNRFPKSLFKRLAGDHIKSVQWGREHEAESIAAVEKALGVKVVRTGLWLHPCGFLGASPDGLIGEDAIVEGKCPFKYRAMSKMEEIKSSTEYIISADVDGNIVLNRNHDYFFQVQMQLALTKRKICHLVIWTPEEVVIFEIKAEDFESNINTLKNFYLTHYVKFLLGEEHAEF